MLALLLASALVGPPDPPTYRAHFDQARETPRVSVWKPVAAYGVANAFDLVTGLGARARGGVESNPMGDPWLVAGVSFVAEVLLDLAAQRWAPPVFSRFLRVAALVAYGSIGARNQGTLRH